MDRNTLAESIAAGLASIPEYANEAGRLASQALAIADALIAQRPPAPPAPPAE